jgi:hypothetical protein
MDPIINNVRIQRGEIIRLVCTVHPVPTSILNWTIAFKMKNNYGDLAAILSKAAVITDPANGEFTITLSHAETNITPRAYVYDIWRTDGGNEVVLGMGDFVIAPEVTY